MKKQVRFRKSPQWQPKRLSLAIGLVGAVAALPAQAVPFKFVDDEVTGSFDTTLSYGSLWRVTGPDRENIAIANGGSRASANFDNGNQNYDRGEQVSSVFRMSNELDLNYKNFGAFVRVLSFYDRAIQTKGFGPNRGDPRVIKNRLGHDYEIYDAYVRGAFTIGERNLNVRLGKQVVNWGESTFIPNGINAINPIDVARLRAPGAELKDAFLPVNMLWASQEITENITIEAFNQFGWRPTRLEPNGSYFSTNDIISPGGEQVIRGSGTVNEDTVNASDPVRLGGTLTRTPDRRARNSNQFGIATRILAPNLNNTEFGIYYMNYHSRTPIISGTTGTFGSNPASPGFKQAAYFNEYPENIRLFGLSFNTLGPFGIALQGEYSYRPNQPLQLAAPDLLAELILQGCANTPTGIGKTCSQPSGPGQPVPGAIGTGVDASGGKRVRFHQVQMTATQTFGPRLMSNQVVGIIEAGYTYMDLPNGLRFNGTGVDFGSATDPRSLTNPSNLDGAAANRTTPLLAGFATRNSYGYRAVVRADYLSLLGPVNVSPRIAWSHDMRGTSPTFTEGVKAISVGVNFNYQQNWQADVSYTNFFGGNIFTGRTGVTNPMDPNSGVAARSSNNPLSDRDFVAATVSYSF